MQFDSFIEAQFPVSKISKESYKERMANNGQTLTGLGKWWGRKPLILVRATILGLLMPQSDDPKRDRDIFLKILTMDDEGLWLRKNKNIPVKECFERVLADEDRERFFKFDDDKNAYIPELIRGLDKEEKQVLQRLVFDTMSYDEKLMLGLRPEHIDLDMLATSFWDDINAHLGTKADSLQALIDDLGQKRFGHTPRVGDAFCGGGSIPFEAARMGCEAYASDLNPVAALLTWAALNIIGGGEEVVESVKKAQQEVYDAVDAQITEWGIEHNEEGWRADAYLYCVEARDPYSGYMVPLAPSWVIGEKSRCVAKLVKNDAEKRYDIEIHSDVTDAEMLEAKENGTVKNSALVNHENKTEMTPISTLRGDKYINGASVYGLRMWENDDLVPRPDDVFQEKLYCVRYVETYYERLRTLNGKKVWEEMSKTEVEKVDLWFEMEVGHIRKQTRKHYCTPSVSDLKREQKALDLIKERFHDWQEKGFIPSMKIESGAETDRLFRERGWTYWHHLFTPRQLLVHGLFASFIENNKYNTNEKTVFCLGIGKLANWDSRLTRWLSDAANEKVSDVFTNQALNTFYNFAGRAFLTIDTSWNYNISEFETSEINKKVELVDTRQIKADNDFWITDPPYSDAIMYHELGDFFLAWYEKQIPNIFPKWYATNKKALAIKGSDEGFRNGMVEAYSNLARHMPDNGAQVVMFTHSDASVWADLTLILWASGLQVSAAWTIATETASGGIKSGMYVQGTVIMILRKQTSEEVTFINEVYPEVEEEVKAQMERMLALDDKEDKNFGDSDYQLAAYAAALRVLTKYKTIHPIDVNYELSKPKKKGEKSQIEELIEKAVEIATNYLVPEDLSKDLWLKLNAEERFYLKGLEVETHGEYRSGVFQEFARGFGLKEYKHLLSTGKANETRIKSASEFKNKELDEDGFGATVIRKLLFGIYETTRQDDDTTFKGRDWLNDEIKDYWGQRKTLIELLTYIERKAERIGDHWLKDAEGARTLRGSLENHRM